MPPAVVEYWILKNRQLFPEEINMFILTFSELK